MSRGHFMWISAFTPGAELPRLRDVLYLAEFYLPGGTVLTTVTARARAGAELATKAGTPVRLVQMIFVPEDDNCFAVYRADSARQVAAAGGLAGLAFDRVVAAECVA